jgi:hypothetical protein
MVATTGKRHGELTLTEAAVLLGRPKITLYKWIRKSDAPWRYAYIGGARHLLVRKTDICRVAEERGRHARRRTPRTGTPAQAQSQTGSALRAAIWWTWSFRVVDGPPAQASLAYRREYHEMLRQWKKGA